MKKPPQKISENPLTTITGALSTVAGLAISLIPHDVWATCSNAIAETSNPILTAGLVVVGISLTIIGPSLSRKK